jgi:hypothetical protein
VGLSKGWENQLSFGIRVEAASEETEVRGGGELCPNLSTEIAANGHTEVRGKEHWMRSRLLCDIAPAGWGALEAF